MTDKLREAAQMALDALIDAADSQSWEMQQNIEQHGEWYRRSVYLKQATAKSQEAIEALRAALANEFNPDWDAMAVMVEVQQRMAKRIEELESALAQPEQTKEPIAWMVITTDGLEWEDNHTIHPVKQNGEWFLQFPIYLPEQEPPQREFIGLNETDLIALQLFKGNLIDIAKWVEAKLKEKNA